MTEEQTPKSFYVCEICGQKVDKKKACFGARVKGLCEECFRKLPFCPILKEMCGTDCVFFKPLKEAKDFVCLLRGATSALIAFADMFYHLFYESAEVKQSE